MRSRRVSGVVTFVLTVAACATGGPAWAQETIRAEMAYQAPGTGPAPNFSPKGTQVPLTDLAQGLALPEGATRPARSGLLKIGVSEQSWLPVLVTSAPDHPADFCRLYVDRNRNGDFFDDGAALTSLPTVREKTGDTWTSFNRIGVTVPYPGGASEPYMFNVWLVRAKDAAVPEVLRYSVASWRSGTATVQGVPVLVAVMDGNNDAVFSADDTWSVLEASATNAPKQVLSHVEARDTKRLMFVASGAGEFVLQFRSVSPNGRVLMFDRVHRPVTKAADRAGDDTVSAERSRPRATAPFPWGTSLDAGLAGARKAGSRVIVDFWATWCGPCKTMDEWVWSDAEVASALAAGYVGVRLDGDVEKRLAERFTVAGYPTMIVLDAAGNEVSRLVGYQSSKALLEMLRK